MKSPRIPRLSAPILLALAPFTAGPLTPSAFAAEAAATSSVTIAVSTEAGEAAYGLAAKLPKDTEAFVSLSRLSELWNGFRKSNFVRKALANKDLVRALDLDDVMEQWDNDPNFQTYAGMAGSLLGGEVLIAFPAGFTENVSVLLKNLPALQMAFFQARIVTGSSNPGMPKEMLPVIEAISDMNVPPLLIALKAGEHKDTLKALIGQALSSIPSDVMEKLDRSESEIGGYQFGHLSVKAGKAMPEREQSEMKRDLARAAGDEKGAALAKKLLAKSAELSWGWVGDHLVLSIGQDHSHLKFATAADSILTHPDVAPRAAQFAAKKPFGFSYTGSKSLRAMHELGGLFGTLVSLAETAKAAGVPVKLDNAITELKALDQKASALWPNDADAAVSAAWWDGGLHAEFHGGPKPRAFDNSKPLTLESLAGDKTFLMLDGRSNGPFRDRVFDLAESFASAIWNIYQKDVKSELPDDVRTGTALGEAFALPVVKDLWKSLQNFRAALGTESALLVNLDGAMPDIPQANIPPDISSKGRIPRLAWVSELKDRAKLAEAWTSLQTIINQASALASAQSGMNLNTTPVSKKQGGVELFGYELPIDTGDVWPHIGVSGTHWFLSTSPALTSELAGKSPAPTGPAAGSHWKVNFPALWNFAADWAKIIPAGPREGENIDFALSLLRSIGSLDIHCGEENGQTRDTIRFIIKDAD